MKLLIVDDDELMQMTMRKVFKGHELFPAKSYNEAQVLLSQQVFTAAFLDIQLEKNQYPGDGITLLKRIREKDSFLPCVMISGLDDKATFQQCLEAGAVDYVVKGSVNPEAYRYALYKCQVWRKLLSDSSTNQMKGASSFVGHEIRGESKSILKLKEHIQRLGQLPGPFLILGATGTGKELVARSLWAAHNNPNRPFVAVNCASLPENLVESELFGFERGAFTGAQQMKTGLFEAANGGDIFLDEIGELSLDLQAKFLRVLQEKKVRRLGSDRERPVEVRVIAATNIDLLESVSLGEFREDLFYRLNVHQLKLPPLKERADDVLPLLKYFLSQYDVFDVQIDKETQKRLRNYDWPGNIRQLKAFVEYLRPYTLSSQALITSDLVDQWMEQNILRSKETKNHSAYDPQVEVKQAFENKKSLQIVDLLETTRRSYVEAALGQSQGNRSQAAKILGISRQRLTNWLQEWGHF